MCRATRDNGGMKMMTIVPASVLTLALAACDEATSTLQEIEDTAAQARVTATEIDARTNQIQQAVENPAGALRDLVSANLAKTPTDQLGIYLLTDLQTGCQFLATYGDDGTTVSSIAPRVEATADGDTRQRCVAVRGPNTEAQTEG